MVVNKVMIFYVGIACVGRWRQLVVIGRRRVQWSSLVHKMVMHFISRFVGDWKKNG